MTSKKFAAVLVLALISVLLLLGASLLYQSGVKADFGKVTAIHNPAHNRQLAMTTFVRFDWPLHPKHRMQFIQIYDETGNVIVESFSAVDHGVADGGEILTLVQSLRGRISECYPMDKAEAKNVLGEMRYKFGLLNSGN